MKRKYIYLFFAIMFLIDLIISSLFIFYILINIGRKASHDTYFIILFITTIIFHFSIIFFCMGLFEIAKKQTNQT